MLDAGFWSTTFLELDDSVPTILVVFVVLNLCKPAAVLIL